jgi:hypothetical protein
MSFRTCLAKLSCRLIANALIEQRYGSVISRLQPIEDGEVLFAARRGGGLSTLIRSGRGTSPQGRCFHGLGPR